MLCNREIRIHVELVASLIYLSLFIKAASKCKHASLPHRLSQPKMFSFIGNRRRYRNFRPANELHVLVNVRLSRPVHNVSLALSLSSRFQQVNKVLSSHKSDAMLSRRFGSKHRQYHRKLAGLVNDVDGTISNLTMFALSNNLSFICTSLLNSL